MTLPHHLALRLLFLVVITLFCIVIVIHDLPDESAKARGHRLQEVLHGGMGQPVHSARAPAVPEDLGNGATGLGLRRPPAGRGARRIDAAVKRQEERLALLERGRRGDAD